MNTRQVFLPLGCTPAPDFIILLVKNITVAVYSKVDNVPNEPALEDFSVLVRGSSVKHVFKN